MKKKIKKTLQMLEPRPMPDKEKILAACPVAPVSEEPRKSVISTGRRFSPVKAVALAMSALLVIGGGIGIGGAVVAEAKEYQEAVDFFEQYNLSAEGFTRSEVKKIYKDIVSESFTYEKTEQALASGLEGYEIQAQPLDSEGLKRVWMVGYEYGVELKDYAEMEDEYRCLDWKHTDENGTRQYVQWQKNEEKQWELYLKNFSLSGAVPAGDKVMLVGAPWMEEYKDYTLRVYLLNSDSTEIWKKDFSCPFPNWGFVEYLYEDDTVTLFIAGFSYQKVWIVTLDMDGNVVNEEMVDCGHPNDMLINDVVRLGDDYLMTTRYGLTRKTGNKIETLQLFGNDKEEYHFTDMVEFNGLIYLSGMMYPKGHVYEQFEEAHTKDGKLSITDEEAYAFYAENHTAVLMICDPATGEPQSFYTVPGAKGGTLSVKGDKLTWDVQRYTKAKSHNDMKYYQATGSFGKITAAKWQYVFTPYGQVVGEKNTYLTETFEAY